MKLFCPRLDYLNHLICLLFIFLLSSAAEAQNKIIRCKTADEKSFRVWKVNFDDYGFNLWILNNGTFYPFCAVGLSVNFPNGRLCAYKKNNNVGTVATFIDIQKPEITDILIREDTILDNPNTWKQKAETACELIRE